jgi:hypothetical protein
VGFELATGLIGVLLFAAFAGFVWKAVMKTDPRIPTEDEELCREKDAAVMEAMRWLGQTQGNRRR